MQSSPSCLMLLSLSLSLCVLPQSKYNLAPIWFNHRGLIPGAKWTHLCVERKRKKEERGEKWENRKSSGEEKRGCRGWRGMMGRHWIASMMRRGRENKARCAQWTRSLIGLRLVAPLQSLPLAPDRNQIILKFFSKSKENMLISSRF